MLWTRDKGMSLGWIITNSITNSLQAKNGCLFKMRMTNDSNIQLTAQFRHHWHLPDISNKLSVENLLSNFQQFQILTATRATVLVSRGTLAFDFIKIELKLFPAFVVFKLYPPTAWISVHLEFLYLNKFYYTCSDINWINMWLYRMFSGSLENWWNYCKNTL